MTIEDIKSLNYVTVEEYDAFYKVTTDSKHVLAVDVDDVRDYFSAQLYYMPKRSNYDNYKVYTTNKDAQLKEQQAALLAEEENNQEQEEA